MGKYSKAAKAGADKADQETEALLGKLKSLSKSEIANIFPSLDAEKIKGLIGRVKDATDSNKRNAARVEFLKTVGAIGLKVARKAVLGI